MSTRPPHTSQSGVALITTVIVVAVLAVVAVAFMQSTSVDRLSSRTVRDYFEAQLAAEAASSIGSGELARLLATYPDSVTAWQNIGGARTNEATVLYVRAQAANTNLGARPGQHGAAITLLARPLVSGGALVPLGGIGSAMPFAGPGPAQVNLNATNATQPVPLVGLRSMTNGGAPVTAANWIYVGRNPGPTNTNNPAIARYAYWIEDESFKVNLNIATNGPRGANSPGTGPREIRIDGSFGSSSNAALRSVNVANVMTARRGLPSAAFPSASTAAIPAALQEQAASDELRFISTVNSAGLDISRGGFKRFNINSITNNVTAPTDAGIIRTNLDRVIAAITNSNSVPEFGQRFYRLANTASAINATNAVSARNQSIYVNKIAANLMDFVDTNNQPTLINNDGTFTVRTGPPAAPVAISGLGPEPNPVAAIGVENVPRLQEFAVHAKLLTMNPIGYARTNPPPPATARANFEFTLDYYFEFWNAGTRDIVVGRDLDPLTDDLGPTFLKVLNQVPFDVPSYNTRNRDFEVSVPDGTRFAAGGVTVLTTSPEGEFNRAPNFTAANIVSLGAPDAVRRYTGVTANVGAWTNNGRRVSNGIVDTFYRVGLSDGVTVNSTNGFRNDYETEMLLRNDVGHLESFPGLPIGKHKPAGSASALDLAVTNNNLLGGNDTNFVRGGSLRGNGTNATMPSSAEGDPRALNEQLEFLIYQTSSSGGGTNNDQTRFYNTMTDGDLGDSTIGAPPATTFVRPDRWTDHSSNIAGAANAPLILRSARLTSIGDLGHLTDPARVTTPSGSSPWVLSRGGGRTLRIGQPEHPNWYWNVAPGRGSQTEASRAWTSWRLADVFTTTAPSNNLTAADPLGVLTNNQGVVRGPTNTNGAVLTIPGLINPNGALRDNGAALRAVLHGIEFLPSPDGAPSTAGRRPDTNGITAVVTNLISRMTNSPTAIAPSGSLNVLWERGEISELPLFNSGTTLASVNMSNTFDRGREEVVRRSIEMLTTRGSIFTVYAIGQTLAPDGRVSGTARLKQVVEFTPVYTNPSAAFTDSFDPTSTGAVAARFAPPASYSINVLSSAYE